MTDFPKCEECNSDMWMIYPDTLAKTFDLTNLDAKLYCGKCLQRILFYSPNIMNWKQRGVLDVDFLLLGIMASKEALLQEEKEKRQIKVKPKDTKSFFDFKFPKMKDAVIDAELPESYREAEMNCPPPKSNCSTCKNVITCKNHPMVKGCDQYWCNCHKNIIPVHIPEFNVLVDKSIKMRGGRDRTSKWTEEIRDMVKFYSPLLVSNYGICDFYK